MEMKKKITAANPIIDSDFPDPDIIRVGDTYYMASTTMHFMPGCVILRSYDLVRWEILSHAYQELDNTPRYYMEGNQNIYGEHFDTIRVPIILYLLRTTLISLIC